MAPLRADRGSRPLTPSPNKPSFLCPGSRGPAPPPVPCPLETALSTCSLEAPPAPGETHFVRRVCGLTQTSGRSGGTSRRDPRVTRTVCGRIRRRWSDAGLFRRRSAPRAQNRRFHGGPSCRPAARGELPTAVRGPRGVWALRRSGRCLHTQLLQEETNPCPAPSTPRGAHSLHRVPGVRFF